jgi:Ni,Fe-hydrogenase III large subunit
LADIGAICNDAAFALLHARCNLLREDVMRAMARSFGHRFAMDRIVPGGVTVDLSREQASALEKLGEKIATALDAILDVYDGQASLQDRTVETGQVSHELVERFGAGGFVGRGSGRAFDARCHPGYLPYVRLKMTLPVLTAGDVDARLRVRTTEIRQSLALIDEILAHLPDGAIRTPLAETRGREACGMALVESFRGDVFLWVRLATDGTVARCHARDPSWFQWPLLEAAIENNIVADFPLCNKSFNCSYAGHDL